jgi:hypothetical protein
VGGFLVPTHAVLLRWCLAHGLRTVQLLTLMTRGPTRPAGAYLLDRVLSKICLRPVRHPLSIRLGVPHARSQLWVLGLGLVPPLVAAAAPDCNGDGSRPRLRPDRVRFVGTMTRPGLTHDALVTAGGLQLEIYGANDPPSSSTRRRFRPISS